jgi:hypothetical protein
MMKMALFILLASISMAMAGDLLIIAVRDDASAADKIKVRDKIKELPLLQL